MAVTVLAQTVISWPHSATCPVGSCD